VRSRRCSLLAPLENPGIALAAAANYKDHQARLIDGLGRPPTAAAFSKDDSDGEFFLKPSSSIIGPGGTIVIPKVSNHVGLTKPSSAWSSAEGAQLDRGAGARLRLRLHHLLGQSASAIPGAATARTRATSGKAFDTFTALGPCDS